MKITPCFALCVSLSTSAYAQQNNITPEGAARSVSLVFFVGELCSKYYSIDREITKNYSLAMAEVGNKMIGVKPFGKIASVEIARRAKEIDATGPEMWCSYQRPNLNALGLKAFLN